MAANLIASRARTSISLSLPSNPSLALFKRACTISMSCGVEYGWKLILIMPMKNEACLAHDHGNKGSVST